MKESYLMTAIFDFKVLVSKACFITREAKKDSMLFLYCSQFFTIE